MIVKIVWIIFLLMNELIRCVDIWLKNGHLLTLALWEASMKHELELEKKSPIFDKRGSLLEFLSKRINEIILLFNELFIFKKIKRSFFILGIFWKYLFEIFLEDIYILRNLWYVFFHSRMLKDDLCGKSKYCCRAVSERR